MDPSASFFMYISGVAFTMLLLFAVEAQKDVDLFYKPVFCEGSSIYIRKGFIFAIIAFIPLWYMLAFRGITVGNDTIGTYYRIYKYSLRNYAISTFGSEFAYYLLNRLVIRFNTSYHAVIIVASSITWILFFSYIYRNSNSPSISILVFFLSFFYFRQYNGVRQLMAEAILLQGFRYIYQRKLIKYCIVVAIAFCFHNTAIILLPLYFLYKIKLNPKMIAGIIAATKIGTSFMINVLLPRILTGTKYFRMIYDIRSYSGGYWISDMFVSGVILFLCVLAILMGNDDLLNFNTWLILFTFVLAINSNLIPMVGRVMWYSNINLMICVPLLISRFKRRWEKVLVFGVIVSVLVSYFFQQWSLGIESVQHYVFWNGVN